MGPLRDEALPLLRRLGNRLELARHEARIDDRTGGDPPSVRFQVRPWAGPLESSDEGVYPALELVETADGDTVLVRTWLDPTADAATTEHSLPVDTVAERLNRLLLDFVELALSD